MPIVKGGGSRLPHSFYGLIIQSLFEQAITEMKTKIDIFVNAVDTNIRNTKTISPTDASVGDKLYCSAGFFKAPLAVNSYTSPSMSWVPTAMTPEASK